MMQKCLTCGAVLNLQADGTYRCKSCGNRYTKEDLSLTKSKASTSIRTSAADGADVFERAENGIIEITWFDTKYRHSGSGFLLDKNGYAITNAHVVSHESGESCVQVNVKIAGENVNAKVLNLGDTNHGKGQGDDLALIKLDKVPPNAHPLKFANFNNVRNGQRIFVIGNSLGAGTCITAGIVSDRYRNVNGKMLMMTDCAINGGNSGGPVFNEDGDVIALVVSRMPNAEGMNYAIPSSTVCAYLSRFTK